MSDDHQKASEVFSTSGSPGDTGSEATPAGSAAPTGSGGAGKQGTVGPMGLFVILVVGLIAVAMLLAPESAPLDGWHKDLEAALAQAAESDQPVLAFFTLPGCPPCSMMKKDVIPQGRVQKELSRFVKVEIIGGRSDAPWDKYRVSGAPTFLILNAKGEPLNAQLGPSDAEDFIQFLQSVSGPSGTQS